MFGGEGLFVTTLKGPGTVWLQGMPPDRMISEISRRVPGGGIGFGIPIGVGGSSGAGDAAGGTGVEEGAAAPGEEGIAASDAAIEADRQATVATSGAMQDSDSPDALFGDAAPKEMPPLTPEPDESFGEQATQDQAMSEGDTFSADQGFSDETTFGDDEFNDEFNDQSSDFGQDDTSFSSSEQSDVGDSLSDAAGDVDTGSVLDTAKSVISSLWDFFNGDD
ncbi:hypothetical protein MHU86_24688 [Fragilaria crotonensis]|nr:hypothetical protein MHU86_24688 [Fragilaria crotonensis]